MQQFGEVYGENYKQLHGQKSLVMPNLEGGLQKHGENGKKEDDEDETKLKDLGEVMQKYSPSFWHGWQERYVELKNKKLKYFKSKDSKLPQGVLNFDHFECKVMSDKELDCFKLTIVGQEREFYFKAPSVDSSQMWQKELRKHIE